MSVETILIDMLDAMARSAPRVAMDKHLDALSDEQSPSGTMEIHLAAKELIEVLTELRANGSLQLDRWISSVRTLRPFLTAKVIQSLGQTLPKRNLPYPAWQAFLERTDHVDLASEVWSRGAIHRASFKKEVRAHLSEVWNSAAADVYIRLSKPTNLKQIWDVAMRTPRTSAALMPADEILSLCLVQDSKTSLAAEAIRLFAQGDNLSKALLLRLSANMEGANALFRLFSCVRRPTGKKRPAVARESAFLEVTRTVESALATFKAPELKIATAAVALCRLALWLKPTPGTTNPSSVQESLQSYLRALLSPGPQNPELNDSSVIAVSGGEARRLLSERHGALATSIGSEFLDSASNIERLNGRLEVLLPVVDALARNEGDSERIQRLKSVLFNLRARPQGAAGQVVKFDPVTQELVQGECQPGEAVEVVSPAWYLGGETGQLLQKARVQSKAR